VADPEGGVYKIPLYSGFGFTVVNVFLIVEYICHVYVRSDSLAGVVIGDHEYPNRVAHTLLNKVGDFNHVEFKKQNKMNISN
jgi:hypothetical protein